MIGDEATDIVTRKWAAEAFDSILPSKFGKNSRVLELMSGTGRYVPMLKDRFEYVEVLDGCEVMMK